MKEERWLGEVEESGTRVVCINNATGMQHHESGKMVERSGEKFLQFCKE